MLKFSKPQKNQGSSVVRRLLNVEIVEARNILSIDKKGSDSWVEEVLNDLGEREI